ncbi:efflux RND transporter periplasmic adaptor subunit [Coralloluteibacterium stylophorae]|uniref:Efflux RND transporter periplasmic adaptor subunit n=1 Tax=Coralloluteibacterium stylophorae TaxID=1776034 RepID=A0A8J8AX53_9GAMM|nr:efflux RND transporter periplasmic adaptor subunit [Coralloluteibacterium stylophorae]MBS7458230.1 efflux RND transporter periplasmic adaptor subunit [Coralloluteibacterium stylophorae]
MNASSDLLKELRIERRPSAPPPPPSRRRWPWLVAAVVPVALVAWFLLGRQAPIPVRTAQAQAITGAGPAQGASVLDATGYVTARRQATVSAKITGKVEDVLIEEGQRVEAGEILARLEPIDADAQRALAQAQLAAARTQVAQARAQLTLAEKTLVRSRELSGRRLIAQAQLDQAQAERDALVAQLATAERNVEVASESLKVADIGVDNTVVRAPFAGVITVKAAQPGEIVSPISAGGGFTRTGIGTVVDMDSLEVQVDVGESFIGRVRPDQRVTVTLNAYPDWRIPGSVIAIVPTADRSKATVKVRIRLDEKDARIVPEMGARVSFLDDAQQPAAAAPAGVHVPAAAVVPRDGAEVVFVVRDGQAARREVEADAARGGQRRVQSGLAIGERVVLSPPAELADGSAVQDEAAGG